ncbi:MAG: extracellular solute-binding protein [Clostridia bacterium]|nr:extracellular solute-binding protein [Clostridia bacterium]
MKQLKRMLALMLALALCFSLAACGGSGNGGKDTGTLNAGGISEADAFDTDAFIATIPEELKGTTIKFLNWYDPYDFGQEGQVIDSFEQATGISVEVIDVEYGEAYAEKLAGLVATGDGPDVFAMDLPKANFMKYAQPITKATGYDFSDKAWSDTVKEYYSVDGQLYAANLKYTPFIRMLTVFYNKQVMEEFGFSDPWELYKEGKWTWQEVEKMCAEFIKQGPDYYGVGTVNYEMVASSMGLDFMKYDGKQWSLDLFNADVLEAWRWTLEKKAERIVVQSTNTTFDAAKPKSLFFIRNTAGLEKVSTWVEKIKKYGYFGAAPMPYYEGKEAYSIINELNAFAVAIGAKNPKAVPYFLSYFCNLAKYDVDAYYFDEQSKEVALELMGTDNKFLTMSKAAMDFEHNPFSWNLFNNGTAAQITTFIQSMEYKCQDNLTILNEVLANMQK